MDMTGEHLIPAPRETVWRALNDPELLKRAIPGCEEVVKLSDTEFTANSVPWQTATVYFAIIDLVAAVGLWLSAVWGAVVWLTAAVSMAAVEAFFPQIYGGSVIVVAVELALLCCYLVLAMQSAREHPH